MPQRHLTRCSQRPRFDPLRYEKIAFRNLGGSFVSESELSDIVEFSQVEIGSLVLDVGMGTGRVLRRLASKNPELVGVDADSQMVRRFVTLMRATDARTQRDIHVVVASAEYLPFKDDLFGAVVCIRVLRYLDQPRIGISEMCRVLTPKGRIVLEFSNVFRPQSILQVPGYAIRGSCYPRLFTRRTIFKWLSKEGVRVGQLRGWHRVPVELMGRLNGLFSVRILTHFDQ